MHAYIHTYTNIPFFGWEPMRCSVSYAEHTDGYFSGEALLMCFSGDVLFSESLNTEHCNRFVVLQRCSRCEADASYRCGRHRLLCEKHKGWCLHCGEVNASDLMANSDYSRPTASAHSVGSEKESMSRCVTTVWFWRYFKRTKGRGKADCITKGASGKKTNYVLIPNARRSQQFQSGMLSKDVWTRCESCPKKTN